MEKEKRIKEEIDKTISIIEELDSLENNPYLFSKIIASYKEKTREKTNFVHGILKAAVAVILIFFNIYTIWDLSSQSENDLNKIRSQYIDAIGTEYKLNQTYYYSYNIE